MILELPLTLARHSGLLAGVEENGRWYIILTVLTLLNTVNFVCTIGMFMVQNANSLDDFTNAFGAFSNMTVNLLKTLMFLATNQSLKRILENLNPIALDKSRSNFSFSASADRATDSYVKKFLIVVYFAVFGITAAPLLAMGIEYVNKGEVITNRYELPFKSSYPYFDVTSSPFYEVAYIIMAIGIPACANCIVAIDTIFMGLCLHTVALFRDLKERIRRLDVIDSEVDFNREMGAVIKYHNQILDLMKDIESVFSRLFFTQFNGTIFILCSQSYLAAMNLGNIEIVSNITFYLASATQFLIYTHFGELLATESLSVAIFTAGQNWYEKPPKWRHAYRMIIHRADSSRGVSYMNWIFCNRRLFLTLIMSSYNVFAVLQKVREKDTK